MYLECRHILTSGKKCQSPALRGRAYCYFHYNANLQRHAAKNSKYLSYTPDLQLPVLEDPSSIQLAISEVVLALAQNRIDPKRAGRILFGLQLAITNGKRARKIIAKKPVRQISFDPEGEPLGPEVKVYEDGEAPTENEDAHEAISEAAPEDIPENTPDNRDDQHHQAESNQAGSLAPHEAAEQQEAVALGKSPTTKPEANPHQQAATPPSVERLRASLDEEEPDPLRRTIRDFVRELRSRHPHLRR